MSKEQLIQSLVTTSDTNSVDIGDFGGNAAIKSLSEFWLSQDISNTEMATDLNGAATHLLALSLIANGTHSDFDEAESAAKHLMSNIVH